MKVSLVCTVRDEADSIGPLLDSMLAQRRPADEIIVNDCGSRDATAAIVARYAERDGRIILVSGGWNIPSGRNNAIRHARYAIVACTDAGLTLDPNWLGRLVAPIERDEADLVGGFHRAEPHTLFELALGATNYRSPAEVDPARFMPFGQAIAFRKALWHAVGGFPEWANHCEDLLFDITALRLGYRSTFVPDALVHFRPRSSLRAFFRQYFNYAIGDGRADLWRKRYALRYSVYCAALLLFVLIGKRKEARPVAFAAMLVGAFGYTRKPYARLWRQAQALSLPQKIALLGLVPTIRVVGDVAKMLGYPVGVVRRMRL